MVRVQWPCDEYSGPLNTLEVSGLRHLSGRAHHPPRFGGGLWPTGVAAVVDHKEDNGGNLLHCTQDLGF